MRIAIYIEPWIQQRAGISVFTKELVKAAESSLDHDYVLVGSRKIESILETIVIPRQNMSNWSISRWLGIGQIDLTKHGVDCLVDTTHFGTLGVIRAPKKVLVVHDLTALMYPEYHRWSTVLGHRLLLKRSLKSADQIVTVSEQTKTDLLNYSPVSHKTKVIHPGVRSELESVSLKTKRIKDPSYFVCVGTFEPRKNHGTIIEAFKRYCKEGGSASLILIGDSGWKTNVRSLVRRAEFTGRISIEGFVTTERLIECYREAIGSIYLSHYEGFGFPILESMAVGCPVITSDLGSMKEIGGEGAILVPPTSAEALTKAMHRLSTDEKYRSTYVEKGLERASQFSWKKFLVEIEMAINEITR